MNLQCAASKDKNVFENSAWEVQFFNEGNNLFFQLWLVSWLGRSLLEASSPLIDKLQQRGLKAYPLPMPVTQWVPQFRPSHKWKHGPVLWELLCTAAVPFHQSVGVLLNRLWDVGSSVFSKKWSIDQQLELAVASSSAASFQAACFCKLSSLNKAWPPAPLQMLRWARHRSESTL